MAWRQGVESLRLLDMAAQYSILYAGKEEGHIKGPRVKLEGHGVDALVEDAKITVKLI